MHRFKIFLVTAGLLLAGAPLSALPEPTKEELEHNRRKLNQWRNQPEVIQRLRGEAQAFLALPAERQQQLLQIDHDLHQESAGQQARLLNVLGRYAVWLDKLKDEERQKIKEAPDKRARLAIIKELRDQEWMNQYQPKGTRDSFASLKGEEKAKFIARLRQEEKQRRLEWQIAARFWKQLESKTPLPARLTDFAGDVQAHVNEYLLPMLTGEEKDRLDKAQGQWPLYPITLVELADKHPPALPGPEGPRTYAALPQDAQKRFKAKAGLTPKFLKIAEGNWPGFGVAVADAAAKRSIILPHELWPYNYKCLSLPMQEFVKNKLAPVLTKGEELKLLHADADHKWPDYPLTIQELAKNHNLQVPWFSLPGPRDNWDAYRNLKTGAGP